MKDKQLLALSDFYGKYNKGGGSERRNEEVMVIE